MYIIYIHVHCQKLYNLLVQILEKVEKQGYHELFWPVLQSANEFNFTDNVHILCFVLQCQNVQNNCQILLKNIVPNFFKGNLCHVHTIL